MLCANNINLNGSEEQKKAWLPKLCSGEWVGCMAMSEPHVGTDVLGMKTRAKSNPKGYTLDGRKMWITNGFIDEKSTPADLAWVYAVTGNPKERPSLSHICGFKRSDLGYSVGQKIQDKLGMRASKHRRTCLRRLSYSWLPTHWPRRSLHHSYDEKLRN